MDAALTDSKRAFVPKKQPKVRESLPAYGIGDGVLSWRYCLHVRERDLVDRALAIVGGYLRELAYTCSDPEAVKTYLRLHLAAEAREQFAVLFLDAQHRVIAFETMFFGTLTQTSVYPREVALAALRHNAAAVVLAHNHPTGNVQPSRSDELLTNAIKGALATVDVRVLDHVIVGGKNTLSMAEAGLL